MKFRMSLVSLLVVGSFFAASSYAGPPPGEGYSNDDTNLKERPSNDLVPRLKAHINRLIKENTALKLKLDACMSQNSNTVNQGQIKAPTREEVVVPADHRMPQKDPIATSPY